MFTTRPDTLYGATFFVVAPESPLAAQIVTDDRRPEFEAYLEQTRQATEIERQSTDRPEDRGLPRRHAVNPVNGERIPVCAADYVLAEYGTGAIMAVPAHDQRDLDFARAFDLPVRRGGDDRGCRTRGRPASPRPATAPRELRRVWTVWTAGRRRGGDHRRAGRTEGTGDGGGDLPAAGLAAEPATLLGRADPDHSLRALR